MPILKPFANHTAERKPNMESESHFRPGLIPSQTFESQKNPNISSLIPSSSQCKQYPLKPRNLPLQLPYILSHPFNFPPRLFPFARRTCHLPVLLGNNLSLIFVLVWTVVGRRRLSFLLGLFDFSAQPAEVGMLIGMLCLDMN